MAKFINGDMKFLPSTVAIGQGGGEPWWLERQSAAADGGWCRQEAVAGAAEGVGTQSKTERTGESRGGRAGHSGHRWTPASLAVAAATSDGVSGRRQRPGAGGRRQREEGEEKKAKAKGGLHG